MTILVQVKRMSSFNILHFLGIHERHSTLQPTVHFTLLCFPFLYKKPHISLNENGEEDKNK